MISKLSIKWIPYVLVTSMIILLILLILCFSTLRNQDKFGIIDIQKIITHEAKKLAEIYPKGDVPTEKLRALIDSVQSNIQKVAQDKKIILLSRTAVLSGDIPDYTESFIKELEDEVGK